MKMRYLTAALVFSMIGSAVAGGVSGTIKFKDSSKQKTVTISAPAYSVSCRSTGDKYQLPLPEAAKGKSVTIKVEGGMETTVKVPANGYAKVNFVFD